MTLNESRQPVDAEAAQVEALRQAVCARDDFIAIAAHELRNPMTPILGLTELALLIARRAEDTCPPRIVALLERLETAVLDYVARATRLLDVTRIQAGNLRLESSATDLSALVRSLAHKYEIAASHGRSPIELHIEEEVIGLWDPLAVEQIVENLLSNALKFGSGQPVAVRLRAEGGAATLAVQDHGIGMAPDHQRRIFGRFEQVVTQHRGTGFGVGLWVARRLAAAMDGHITVASRLGEGSIFTLTLPFAPAPMIAQDPP